MTKRNKFYLIYFVVTCLFLLLRYIVSVLPLADNWVNWIFSFVSQPGLNLGMVFLLYFVLNRRGELGDIKTTLFLTVPKKRVSPAVIAVVAVLPFFLRYSTIGVSYVSSIITQMFGFVSVSSPGTIYSSAEVLIMEIIVTAIFPAVCEEVLNRGVLLASVRDKDDDLKKVLFIGVMFGLFHQFISQFFYTLYAGCVFAVLAIKFKSIWPAVYGHFVNNFLSVILNYSSQQGTAVGKLYDGYYDWAASNFFIAMLTWTIALAAVIMLCLYIWKNVSSDAPEKGYAPKTERAGVYFGKNAGEELLPLTAIKKSVLEEYGFLLASIAVMTLTTVFSFIWGVLR